MSTVRQITTADELLHAPGIGPCELIRGELVMMSPAGFDHGWIASNIQGCLINFVKPLKLGRITTAETGFWIHRDPDTVRAPDVAFVRANRVPSTRTPGYFEGAPDLAVEVLSPGDRANEVSAKVHEWLESGCVAVWVVDPASQCVTIHRSDRPATRLGVDETLVDDGVLPGFRLPIADIFA